MSYTTTSYGTWNNHINDLSAGLNADVVEALGDYTADYDVDAIASDWRAAINDALPPRVTLSGDEFIGPAHEEDQDWTGYPLEDVSAGLEDQIGGSLDLKAIVDSIDFWEIAARHELWDIDAVAEELKYTGPSAAGSARKTLSRLGVQAATYRPHPTSKRPQALYRAADVREAKANMPGRGKRAARKDAE